MGSIRRRRNKAAKGYQRNGLATATALPEAKTRRPLLPPRTDGMAVNAMYKRGKLQQRVPKHHR